MLRTDKITVLYVWPRLYAVFANNTDYSRTKKIKRALPYHCYDNYSSK
jgi:hypothetical protein